MDKCVSCKPLQLMVLCILLTSIIYQVEGKSKNNISLIINTFHKVIFERAKHYCEGHYTGLLNEKCIENMNVQMELKQYMNNRFASLDIWIFGEKETCKIASIRSNRISVHRFKCSESAYAACKTVNQSRDNGLQTITAVSKGSSGVFSTRKVATTNFQPNTPVPMVPDGVHSIQNITTTHFQPNTTVSMESNGGLSIQKIVIAISSIVLFGLIIIAIYLARKHIQENEEKKQDGPICNQITYNLSVSDSEFNHEYATISEEV